MALPVVDLPHTATKADLEALPEGVKGELIDGVLYAMTRPRAQHQDVAGTIYAEVWAPFHRGRGGPGGWWILVEPGIELPGAPEVSPDVAGWQRARMPSLPEGRPITVVPDWVCEVISPSTRGYQYLVKRRLYARTGVRHLWEVDIEVRTVTVLQLLEGRWMDLGSFSAESDACLPPFDPIPLAVTQWWDGLPEGPRIDGSE